MSATPRTDDQDIMTLISDFDGSPISVVHIEWAEKLETELTEANARIAEIEAQNARLREDVEAKQAEIDLLMLEFCPDEMTPEQLANWASHQRAVSKETEALIESARKPQEGGE